MICEPMMSIVLQNCQIIVLLPTKTWGRVQVVLVVIQNGGTFHSFPEEEIGELLAKNTARRVKRELDG